MILFSTATSAGPMMQSSPAAVHAGLLAGFWLAVVVVLFFTPLFIWLLRRNLRALREAQRRADQHRRLS